MRANELFGEFSKEVEAGLLLAKQAVASDVALYRGVSAENVSHFKKIRNDRKPKDSNPFSVHIFNTFMELSNLEFRKHNSLSVSTSEDQASEYGSFTMRAFPLDGSVFLSSPEIYDMIEISKLIRRAFIAKNMDTLIKLDTNLPRGAPRKLRRLKLPI